MTQLTASEAAALLNKRRNWGRWGEEDQVGAVNLIDDQKRVGAAELVRTGTVVSLSREVPVRPATNNPRPAQQQVRREERASGAGAALEFYGLDYHGFACTHIDALCHAWGHDGMWNGVDPNTVISSTGSAWGGIEGWASGIVTRGVFIDIPGFRGSSYVEVGSPVLGDELVAAAASQNVQVAPGDVVVVYSGREVWERVNSPWGPVDGQDGREDRPGLHVSCLEAFREWDCAGVAWDMHDAVPNEWDLPWTVHGALFSFGMALIDNCELSRLHAVCQVEDRFEFLLVVAPLVVVGGTGSPVNPLAVF